MADRQALMQNLERAYGELCDYLRLPVETRRDRAGIIQAFEFTFELFWKTFQKLAPDEGIQASTPRQALQVGRMMGLIEEQEAPYWGQMLRDRNLTSHIYLEALASEVFERIRTHYVRCFERTYERLCLRAVANGPNISP